MTVVERDSDHARDPGLAPGPDVAPGTVTFRRKHLQGSFSVIVPAFNEGARLTETLPALVAAMREWDGCELIVVDDGSTDDTSAVATQILNPIPRARVVRLPHNLGKGAAVSYGVSLSRGESVLFLDADLSADLADLPALIDGLDQADVVIGSRHLSASDVERPARRQCLSRVFSRLVRSLDSTSVTDTQCGFKAFRAPAAKLLFSLARTNGYAFDVEVLALAARIGYRVREIPVRWRHVEGGGLRPLRDGIKMAVQLLWIRVRWASTRFDRAIDRSINEEEVHA